MATQIITAALTVFYVLWLCFIALCIYRIARAAQRIAEAIYQIARRNQADDHAA